MEIFYDIWYQLMVISNHVKNLRSSSILALAINVLKIMSMTVVLGDFNARVGNNDKIWNGTIGRHGVDEGPTDNGSRLLRLCSHHGLSISGTFFQHKDIHKYTWYQRGTDGKGQIDHVIVRGRWLSAV